MPSQVSLRMDYLECRNFKRSLALAFPLEIFGVYLLRNNRGKPTHIPNLPTKAPAAGMQSSVPSSELV